MLSTWQIGIIRLPTIKSPPILCIIPQVENISTIFQNKVDKISTACYLINVDKMSTIDKKGGANLTNADLLKKKIKESGLKLGFIADKLGVSRPTLRTRIEGESDFRVYEIVLLCELLNITSLQEKNDIFFAKK